MYVMHVIPVKFCSRQFSEEIWKSGGIGVVGDFYLFPFPPGRGGGGEDRTSWFPLPMQISIHLRAAIGFTQGEIDRWMDGNIDRQID